jgi:hypothetical protein
MHHPWIVVAYVPFGNYQPTMGTWAPYAQTIPGSRLYIGLLVHNDVNIVVEVHLTHLVKPNTTYSFQ